MVSEYACTLCQYKMHLATSSMKGQSLVAFKWILAHLIPWSESKVMLILVKGGQGTVIPLSDIAGLDIRTRNGLYPLLFVNVRFMFFKCSVYVLLPSAKERY